MTEDNANYSWDKDVQDAHDVQDTQNDQDAQDTQDVQDVQRSQAVQAAYENEAKAETKKVSWWNQASENPLEGLLRVTMLGFVLNTLNAWIIIALLSFILYFLSK